ncbi:MAG: Smr/MutS family protein [Culicoidibacterales bacterium]
MVRQRAWVKLQPNLAAIEVTVLAQTPTGYTIQLKSGMKTVIQSSQLVRLIEAPQPRQVKVSYQKEHLAQANTTVLDLHGKTVIEAEIAIDGFLRNQKRGSQVAIVFGKGTGALKQALTPYLKKHRHVQKLYTDHLRAAFEIVVK